MRKFFFSALIILLAISGEAQTKINVLANKPGAAIPSTMWGVFFEDINFAADGGLYAEMVKNRSFEFPTPMMGWRETRTSKEKGKYLIINQAAVNASNTRFARITVNAAKGEYILSNEGFRGMGFQKEKQYNFSVLLKTSSANNIKIYINLVNASGKVISSAAINNIAGDWKRYTSSIVTTDTAQRGKIQLVFEGQGEVDMDMVSLFPEDTWKKRPYGLRNDLVQMIADLKPGFIRFPGGCIVEGRELSNRYQWKTTVGDINDRKLIMNRWNVEFRNKLTPDYFQTFGLGFFEYFQLSEDLNAEPLPILSCGMACQYNSAEVAAMDELQPYIDDALDLIEFANGDITTHWGKIRNQMGHPQPFNLKYIGVGNEQWEAQYIERYKVFEKAILDKYPNIKIVAGSGPSAEGEYFNYAWKEFKQLKPALIDEHYYKPPEWFFKNANRYDNYDRKGPKIFAGEYAAHSKDTAISEGRNNWESALAEASFMTGLERNADIVEMASYAPLFAHVDAWQWRPDLIWFDNLQSFGTPNYYVQKLFSANKGTAVIPVLKDGIAISGKDSLYASAVVDKQTNELIIKITNIAPVANAVEFTIDGVKAVNKEVAVQELSAPDLYSFNTMAEPKVIYPAERTITAKGKKVLIEMKPRSFSVIRIKLL